MLRHAGPAGSRLSGALDDQLVEEAVLPLLLAREDVSALPVIGVPYRYYARCGSTNRMLKSEAAELPSGTLVITDDQTEGRGRLGRPWVSEPGRDLTFSVLLKPPILPQEVSLLSLIAGVAITEVLEGLPGLAGRVRVKWPNDVLIDDKKVCGILLESSFRGAGVEWVVIGIGLNVNSEPQARPEAFGQSEGDGRTVRLVPTSLRTESGGALARGSLLAEIIASLGTWWCGTDLDLALERMRARDALRGRVVRVSAGSPDGSLIVMGEAVGIGGKGELLVREQGGRTVPVVAGEVTLGVDITTE